MLILETCQPAVITPEPKPITPAVAPSIHLLNERQVSWNAVLGWRISLQAMAGGCIHASQNCLKLKLYHLPQHFEATWSNENASRRFRFCTIWHPGIKCFWTKDGLQCRQCSEKPGQNEKCERVMWTYLVYFIDTWQRYWKPGKGSGTPHFILWINHRNLDCKCSMSEVTPICLKHSCVCVLPVSHRSSEWPFGWA